MIQKESIKIIDGEEYVISTEAYKIIKLNKRTHSTVIRKIIIRDNLKYFEENSRLWIKKTDLENYILYQEEVKKRENEWLKRSKFLKQKYQDEFTQKKLELKNIKQKYFFVDEEKINIIPIPNSKEFYNPVLFKKVAEFKLPNAAKKCLKNSPIIFIGDLIQFSEYGYYRNYGMHSCSSSKCIHDKSFFSHSGTSFYAFKILLSKYNLTFNMRTSHHNFYWPSPTLIDYSFNSLDANKINKYIQRREQEQAEIENLIRANNPSKSLTPLD